MGLWSPQLKSRFRPVDLRKEMPKEWQVLGEPL